MFDENVSVFGLILVVLWKNVMISFNQTAILNRL